MNSLRELEKKLGYTFKDADLIKTAVTHSSYANENRKSGAKCNERLEFLGDSVLGMTVAELIYKMNPDMPEGQMTRLRAELVCEKSLAALAVTLKLGSCLRLGKGEEGSGGRTRPSILADAFEAVLAAMFLDGGAAPVAALIEKYLSPQSGAFLAESSDYKTALQEAVQEKSGQILSYHTTAESGPDHMKQFTVEVHLNGEVLDEGTGRSKKEAEQAAARAALGRLAK